MEGFGRKTQDVRQNIDLVDCEIRHCVWSRAAKMLEKTMNDPLYPTKLGIASV